MCHTPAPPLKPVPALPADNRLPGISLLFDNGWVWQAFCQNFGVPDEPPKRIRPSQIRYEPGRRALVSYLCEWQWDRWVVEDQFAVELETGKSERVFRYPKDPYLPGLRVAASATDAHQLLTKYVPIHPHRLRVEAVRYRPGTRAVLRHIATWRTARAGKMTFFVRVMSPIRVPRLLVAVELARQSGFILPELAGCWAEGGVVWFPSVPGNTVRQQIKKGTPPDPAQILNALDKLWSEPIKSGVGHTLDMAGSFHATHRLLSQLLHGDETCHLLQHITDVLGPFLETWRPSTLAHNDFYDDQILLAPDGQLVLVDFEETGPGDPLFDVGNMLAHLSWMARFGTKAEACENYRHRMRSAALERFGWEAHDLDLREAYAIFRLSANPFRRLNREWRTSVETGLSLVAEVLARGLR